MAAKARVGDDVESVVWRNVQRFRQDVTAVENALSCDAYRPEMRSAARALLKLSATAGALAEQIRNATPLQDPGDA